jgi:hypothetical protein
MVTFWWSQHVVIHYSFLRSGQAITADVYWAELQTMLANLAIKQPRLINRSSPLLFHDNETSYSARNRVDHSGTAVKNHSSSSVFARPYSNGLPFFRDLDKKFSSQEAVQNTFTQFVQSRSSKFYRKGINDLPIRWQQCIDNNGNYLD